MGRKLTVSIAVSLSLACGSSAPTAPSNAITPTTPVTAVLTGIVSTGTGSAVAGATVQVTSGANSGLTATTDSSGAYRFDALSTGNTTLVARATGYVDSAGTVTANGANTLNFTLSRVGTTASLSGVARTPSMTGIAGIVVTVTSGDAVGQTALTNVNGQYSFPSLPVGSTNFVARGPDFVESMGSVEVNGTNVLNLTIRRTQGTINETLTGTISPADTGCFSETPIYYAKPCLSHFFEVTNTGSNPLAVSLTWPGSSNLDLELLQDGDRWISTFGLVKPETMGINLTAGLYGIRVWYTSGSVIENYSLTVTRPK